MIDTSTAAGRYKALPEMLKVVRKLRAKWLTGKITLEEHEAEMELLSRQYRLMKGPRPEETT